MRSPAFTTQTNKHLKFDHDTIFWNEICLESPHEYEENNWTSSPCFQLQDSSVI